MAINNRYPASRLKQIKSKGNYWFVTTTKPPEIQAITGGDLTVRKSTKTQDRRKAELLHREIESQIHKNWDDLLERDPLVELLEQHWGSKPQATQGLGVYEFMDKWDGGRVLACTVVCMGKDEWNMELANQLFRYLSHEEATDFRDAITVRQDPYPPEVQYEKNELLRAFMARNYADDAAEPKAKTTTKRNIRTNLTGCPTILEVLPEYMNAKRWKNITAKEKQYVPNYIQHCVDIIGNRPLDQILARDAITIMDVLDQAGKANNTIKTYKRSVSNLLGWAATNLLNEKIEEPWIKANPFKGISSTAYGKKKRSYEALKTDQLHKLFKLNMPNDIWLQFSIGITTGMRLDEIALLEWEQFKIDRNGLRYFDLSLGAIVKNDRFSARTVAIPDCLILPKPATGRLFDWATDDDGKSSKEASKVLNKWVNKIRYNDADDRKVFHSLRHNLTGFMSNLRPAPASEHMDWITGHGMEGNVTASERQTTYSQDIDVNLKYEIVNRIQHPWLIQ